MLKRSFDFISAVCGLLLLSPILLACIILILVTSGRPVFFLQKRVGLSGKPFDIFKFRTMIVATSKTASSVTSNNDTRITPVGKFLRKLKLDELPQLWNVVRGDMSVVGPRPEVPHLFQKYPEPLKSKMQRVRPGITDYASIEYSDENLLLVGAQNPEMVYLTDILQKKAVFIEKYLDNRSFRIDLVIILRTLLKIVKPSKNNANQNK